MQRNTALILLALLAVACPSKQSTQQPPEHRHEPPPSTTDGPPPTNGDDDGGDGDTSTSPPREGPKLPDGPLCDVDADCGAGQVCEGVGCEPGQGRCVDTQRMCTRDLATYCGCDGREFQNSGSCPGRRYAYRGSCSPALEDGEPCTDGRQCRSGQCVGEGLEGCSPGDQGTCGTAACTKDLATYCSCNATEFRASGTCPNRQFAYRGPCEAP